MIFKKIYHIKKSWLPQTAEYQKLRIPAHKIRVQYLPNMNEIMPYYVLNKIKELNLIKKIASGKQVRVGFILDTITKFPTESVYQEMKNTDIFCPFIVLYHHLEKRFSEDHVWKNYTDELNKIKSKNLIVYPGYTQNRKYIPIETYKPDILFISYIYQDVGFFLSNMYANINFLVCQTFYGMGVINYYDYHFNNRCVNTSWKYFVSSRSEYDELVRNSANFGANAVLTGYPNLDSYAKPYESIKIPQKIDNNKKIIIYAPHFTISGRIGYPLGSFHLFYKFFLELAKDNDDINFIFKPHPSLEDAIYHSNVISIDDYKNFLDNWNKLPNAITYTEGEHINIFRKSSLLVTDCGSFTLEWMPTLKPCIYIKNPLIDKKYFYSMFKKDGKLALQTYYVCDSKKQINEYFHKIIRDNYDPKYTERERAVQQIFVNIGNCGKTIVNYLLDVLQVNNSSI